MLDIVAPPNLSRFDMLETLDMINVGACDDDIKSLASEYHPKLTKVSFAGNPIGRAAVEAVCLAVQQGRWPQLTWLELSGTDCNATPYLDSSYWRLPKVTYELISKYGFQSWMREEK